MIINLLQITLKSISACFFTLLFCFICQADSNKPLPSLSVQTAYIHHFINFSKWPATTTSQAGEQFTICIGSRENDADDFQALENRITQQRRIAILNIADTDELEACQVVYISGHSKTKTKEILERINKKAILSVGTSEAFLAMGGIIQLTTQRGQVTFSVNLNAANQAGIMMSANMLEVAEDVIR